MTIDSDILKAVKHQVGNWGIGDAKRGTQYEVRDGLAYVYRADGSLIAFMEEATFRKLREEPAWTKS